MKMIASDLRRYPARKVAREHNCKHHNCEATASISADLTVPLNGLPYYDLNGLPYYEVRCPVCPEEVE